MQNSEIARMFDEYADILEIQGANPFRVRAYRNAARMIGDLAESVADIACRPRTLAGGTARDRQRPCRQDLCHSSRRETFRSSSRPARRFPSASLEMLRISGLGPKKVAIAHQRAEDPIARRPETGGPIRATSPSSKDSAKRPNRPSSKGPPPAVEAPKRFLLGRGEARGRRHRGRPAQAQIGQAGHPGGQQPAAERNGRPISTSLATAKDSAEAMDALAAHPLVEKVLARGETKQRVRLRSGVEMDLRVVPDESYGAAMQYFTGSKEHNIVIRRRALDRGLKVNEYGVFRGDDLVCGRTEEEVYRSVDLPWIPPELRENRGEIERAEKGRPAAPARAVGHPRRPAHAHDRDRRHGLDPRNDRRGQGPRPRIHRHHRPFQAGLDGQRARRRPACGRTGKKSTRSAKRSTGIEVLCGVECDILEDAPARPRRRSAGRGRLGAGRPALRPQAAAGADHQAAAERDQ